MASVEEEVGTRPAELLAKEWVAREWVAKQGPGQGHGQGQQSRVRSD